MPCPRPSVALIAPLLAPLALAACGTESGWPAQADVSGKMEQLAAARDGLDRPTDLAFDPENPDRLWVFNRRTDSVTLIHDAGTPDARIENRTDPFAMHFMDQVAAVSFGKPGTFGTCQDSRNTYNGSAPGNDFMGPALWSSDLEVFAQSNPTAVEFLTAQFGSHTDLGSHLDMLHESPLCIGIAWEQDNIYWVFDGLDGALVRYDFHADHGAGFDDHSDGVIQRFGSGSLKRVGGTVGHVAYDPVARKVFAADSGNGRLAVLEFEGAVQGSNLPVKEPGTQHMAMEGASIETLADKGLERPAGLSLIEGHLVLTDAGTGKIHIFTTEGEELSVLDTGLGEGHLAGIWGETLDDLWFVDQKASRLYRLQR